MTPPSQPPADSPLRASGLSDEWRELHRVLGEYRRWGNLGTTATTFAAASAEAITHCDRIAKACDSLLDSLRVAPVPLPEGAGEPTLGDVLAWLRARRGVSWQATIVDIEEAVAALGEVAAPDPVHQEPADG